MVLYSIYSQATARKHHAQYMTASSPSLSYVIQTLFKTEAVTGANAVMMIIMSLSHKSSGLLDNQLCQAMCSGLLYLSTWTNLNSDE